MKLTKHEHAAVILEVSGRSLVIDPGSFTTLLDGYGEVDALVITHEHADHWTPAQITKLLEHNPKLRIFGPPGVVEAVEDFDVETVNAGDTLEVGEFSLRFFGGTHALIHESMPLVDNVGVLVNDTFYYPGDSFDVPDAVPVNTLAVPVSGPWQKLGESMNFVRAVMPEQFFPTHEMLLSRLGKNLSSTRLTAWAETLEVRYFELEPGESTSL